MIGGGEGKEWGWGKSRAPGGPKQGSHTDGSTHDRHALTQVQSVAGEQARQEALNRQRERLLAQRADDRHRALQRALEEAKATKEAERSSLSRLV